jgi:UDP-N-acetylenolpyruvoylglucosamine reductase
MRMTPTPTMAPVTPQATAQSDWIPSAKTLQQLGWTRAGLSTGDALEAERTAWTFTDREMSLDYRNVGTQAQHGGTFTAVVFLLTPNARVRFFQNDVRMINNALFNRVSSSN